MEVGICPKFRVGGKLLEWMFIYVAFIMGILLLSRKIPEKEKGTEHLSGNDRPEILQPVRTQETSFRKPIS